MAGISNAERTRRKMAGHKAPPRVRDRKPTEDEISEAYRLVNVLVLAASIRADKRKMRAIDEFLARARLASAGTMVGSG